MTIGKKLSQRRERVFKVKQKRFQFTLENVKSLLFPELHRGRCSKLLPQHGQTAFGIYLAHNRCKIRYVA